ncbi:MAG: hypothetical protein FJ267_20185, partial [Planctomycetes bacterium]|nr:hypothetical protein [Planctomycetota bacterium]
MAADNSTRFSIRISSQSSLLAQKQRSLPWKPMRSSIHFNGFESADSKNEKSKPNSQIHNRPQEQTSKYLHRKSVNRMSNEVSPTSSEESKSRIPWRLIGILVFIILVPSMLLIVDETESVLVERFGKIVAVYDQSEMRGLHFKWPWPVESVRRFDRRLQLLSPNGREAFTRDRKNVTVEAYVVWKIADNGNRDDAVALKNEKRTMDQSPVVRFFRTLGSNEVAEARLTSRLQSILTEQVGRVELSDLLRAKNSESGPSTGAGPFQELSAKIRNELSLPDDEGSSLLE